MYSPGQVFIRPYICPTTYTLARVYARQAIRPDVLTSSATAYLHEVPGTMIHGKTRNGIESMIYPRSVSLPEILRLCCRRHAFSPGSNGAAAVIRPIHPRLAGLPGRPPGNLGAFCTTCPASTKPELQ